MSLTTPIVIAPIPATIIAAAIDRLKHLPGGPGRKSELIALVAQSVGRDENEAKALFLRLAAAAIVFRDPRWNNWRSYFGSCSGEAFREFDDLVLKLFATLPLDPDLRFSGDHFFGELLARVNAPDRN